MGDGADAVAHPSKSSASTENERKIAAYDAARARVKIEGNTRAYYVLRAEAAEAEIERLRERVHFLLTTDPNEWKPEVIQWLA